MNRAVLLERLQRVQESPRFQNRDIRSISAILSNEALLKHVEVCEAAAQKPLAQ